jgi:hypothetical protein
VVGVKLIILAAVNHPMDLLLAVMFLPQIVTFLRQVLPMDRRDMFHLELVVLALHRIHLVVILPHLLPVEVMHPPRANTFRLLCAVKVRRDLLLHPVDDLHKKKIARVEAGDAIKNSKWNKETIHGELYLHFN